MVVIPDKIKNQLKRPLGVLKKDFQEVKKLSSIYRITSVGDVCTLGLLANGIMPHLAVFDHIFMRRNLDQRMRTVLELYFKKPKRYKNPQGTVSDEIIKDAEGLISSGGSVLIDGEEDLTALAFIRSATKRDIIVYGQPNKGVVIVKPNKEIKKKIEKWLLTAASLGHKVKRNIRTKS